MGATVTDVLTSGPDLVIAGSARSGTTLLAAQLAAHPRIDAGAVKEPNFFSKHYARGMSWYESYYASPRDDLLRLDASVSYTYPQYDRALALLEQAAPHATVVYVVRDAVSRAVSHYLLNRHYFGHESAPDFGAALRTRPFYTEVSDYERWIRALLTTFPDEQVLVVPFSAVTDSARDVASRICERIGVDAPPDDEGRVQAHQNNVVTFRSETARRVTRRLRHSAAYPKVRRVLGPHTMKRIRSLVTKVPEMPTVDQALASCSPEQLLELEQLRQRSSAAVEQRLRAQDQSWGLDWTTHWR